MGLVNPWVRLRYSGPSVGFCEDCGCTDHGLLELGGGLLLLVFVTLGGAFVVGFLLLAGFEGRPRCGVWSREDRALCGEFCIELDAFSTA